ncbi:hypothetical protein ALNOE001_14760 [Candidatus Methanobinarius endosymbioticus]|uniref:CDP-ribitol ribitolphosphotransferase n=1 Tax=Candidatus Methanobinarius endosymbioticus TaxID=2006182 RepID=A0A366MAC3_9EURY|nr:hypothetical protein ALNOE001_14760 [Candidatus Methanobinarius endosymbioticus]
MKSKLSIKECSIINDYLNIAINCDIDFDPDVFEPKLKIYFENGEENLLLPIIGKNRRYVSYKNMDHLDFEQKFPIDDLFLNKKANNINFYLSLTYGEHTVKNINIDCNLNENNLNYNYFVEFNKSNNNFIILDTSEKTTASYYVKNFLSYIIRLLGFIFSIILIPYFIIETLFIVLKTPNLRSSGGLLYLKDNNTIKRGIRHVLWRMSHFSNFPIEEIFIDFKNFLLNKIYQFSVRLYKDENTIMFISERGEELTGNLKFVYDYILNNESTQHLNVKISTINESFPITPFKHKWNTYKDMVKSEVIVLDNYFVPVNTLKFPNQTLIQLWHACGAFKTFGFTRFGRPGGPNLDETTHRKYDMALVSSDSVVDCYSEAYAMSSDKVLALGIPRTDVFYDEEYIKKTKEDFYKKYPQLIDKKIILFGPTFRGNTRKTGYYPTNKFDPVKIYNELEQEYAIIIKRHFFINNKFEIPKEYSDFVMDLDVSEDINDLLFISDILITDYSSTIFEASLLDISMIFHVFDLDDYISERSFYFEYKGFVPGKITYTQDGIISSIKNKDFETFKINDFKNKFFKYDDGKSSKRVVDYISDSIKKE